MHLFFLKLCHLTISTWKIKFRYSEESTRSFVWWRTFILSHEERIAVRRAAYSVVANANPSSDYIDLLIESTREVFKRLAKSSAHVLWFVQYFVQQWEPASSAQASAPLCSLHCARVFSRWLPLHRAPSVALPILSYPRLSFPLCLSIPLPRRTLRLQDERADSRRLSLCSVRYACIRLVLCSALFCNTSGRKTLPALRVDVYSEEVSRAAAFSQRRRSSLAHLCAACDCDACSVFPLLRLLRRGLPFALGCLISLQ